jgi:hypothetical protein
MLQFGGKDSKRHFTVVMAGKEHGLYVSSTPSSAAKKAVTKLCAANKSKKVQFEIREITQGSKKKTYGPYSGYIEKLKEPIELKGRVIKYNPVVKLIVKTGAKKGGMYGVYGGAPKIPPQICYHWRTASGHTFIREHPTPDSIHANPWRGHKHSNDIPTYLDQDEILEIEETITDPRSRITFVKVTKDGVSGWIKKEYCRSTPTRPAEQAREFSKPRPFKYYSQGNPNMLEGNDGSRPKRNEFSRSTKPVTSSRSSGQSANYYTQGQWQMLNNTDQLTQSLLPADEARVSRFSGHSESSRSRRTDPSRPADEDRKLSISRGHSESSRSRRTEPSNLADDSRVFGSSGHLESSRSRRTDPSRPADENRKLSISRGHSESNRSRRTEPSNLADDSRVFGSSGHSESSRSRRTDPSRPADEARGFSISRGGPAKPNLEICYHYNPEVFGYTTLKKKPRPDSDNVIPWEGHKFAPEDPIYLDQNERLEIEETKTDPESGITFVKVTKDEVSGWFDKKYCRPTLTRQAEQAREFSRSHRLEGNDGSRRNESSRSTKPDTSSRSRGKSAIHYTQGQWQLLNNTDQLTPSLHPADEARGFGVSGHSASSRSRQTDPSRPPDEARGFSISRGARGQSAFNQPVRNAAVLNSRTQDELLIILKLSKQNMGVEYPLSSIRKLYNCVDNSRLLKSISERAFIPSISISEGQVIDLLAIQTDPISKKTFGKIRVPIHQGIVEGFVPYDQLKKTRWCCDHSTCQMFNGPFDKEASGNRRNASIPVTVAVILRNARGDILVGTETDPVKISEFDPKLPGFHLCAGKIDPHSCPVFSCYDELAEEFRVVPVVKDDERDFERWDAIIKPDGNYIMEPWLSTGRALVFVGNVGNEYFDSSNEQYGKPIRLSDPNRLPERLDEVLSDLRRTLPDSRKFSKYKEKIEFKWVRPLPKGSPDSAWQKWSRDNQMYGWGRKLIQDYVNRS